MFQFNHASPQLLVLVVEVYTCKLTCAISIYYVKILDKVTLRFLQPGLTEPCEVRVGVRLVAV